MVQGAGDPALEQRRDQVHSRQHGRPAGGVVVGVAHVGQPTQPSGAVGVDGRAGLDDAGGEGDQLQGAGRSGDLGAHASQRWPSLRSTATMTGTLSPPAPAVPTSTPPTITSSTSTVPNSRSWSGRTIARRSLCSQRGLVRTEPQHPLQTQGGHAVLLRRDEQIAANHVANGVRVRWKIVPAVTDVCRPHAVHLSSTLPVRQHAPAPQRGQTNPSGQRSRSRYSRHARMAAFMITAYTGHVLDSSGYVEPTFDTGQGAEVFTRRARMPSSRRWQSGPRQDSHP